jgi:hypothetical protein
VERRWLGPVWLAAVVLAIYLPDAGQGFIKDDFAWIASSRLGSAGDVWGYVARPASGFFRPIVALSFGIDGILFGLRPLGYGLTNLALVGVCAAGIWRLAGALALTPAADRGGDLGAQLPRHRHGRALDQRPHGAPAVRLRGLGR